MLLNGSEQLGLFKWFNFHNINDILTPDLQQYAPVFI